MYLGTGWPLILFSFPLASKLCPDNYYKQFVPAGQWPAMACQFGLGVIG